MNELQEEQKVPDNDLKTPPISQESENANNFKEETPVKKPTVKKRAAKKSIKEDQVKQIKDPDESEQDISVLHDGQQKENDLSESDQEAAAEEPEPGDTEYKFAFMAEAIQKANLQPDTDQEDTVCSVHIQSAIKNTEEKESKKNKKKKLDAAKSPLCKLVKKDYLKKHMQEYLDLIIDPKYICAKCGRAAHNKKSLCKPIKID